MRRICRIKGSCGSLRPAPDLRGVGPEHSGRTGKAVARRKEENAIVDLLRAASPVVPGSTGSCTVVSMMQMGTSI